MPSRSGFVVFRETRAGVWTLIGEAARKPGATARAARQQAIRDAARRAPRAGEVYAVVLRSEWRIGLDH